MMALAFLLAVAFSGPDCASGSAPPTEPVLRIETEMHSARVNRISIDGTGRYVASGSSDKTVRVWDVNTGQLLRVLRPPVGVGNEAQIYAVAMSPDGASIAVAGWTGFEWDQTNSIYVFDRATGQIKRRISGLPNVILHLAWSRDGSLLAATLFGQNGLRLFRAHDGSEVGADIAYGADSYSVDFDRTGKLVSTSYDGFLRLYRVSERALTLVKGEKAPGAAKPFIARFSPDGSRIAVGYFGSARVDVLASDTLALLYSPDTRDVKHGDLSAVAWSADGKLLYAGGQYASGLTRVIRVWTQAGQGSFQDLAAAVDTVMDIAPLPTGGIIYAAGEPSLGRFDGSGRKIWERRAALADFRAIREGFRVSRDGTVVDFAFEPLAKSPARINVAERRLVLAPGAEPGLAAPVTSAPGLALRDWLDGFAPTLNGQPLKMYPNEPARVVAIAPDRQSIILGGDWNVRRYDVQGAEIWRIPGPVAWAVNVSGDSKVVVAAHADGTIRWYRLSDGAELLSFFPHADRKRWVLWSPSGYYDASPGAEGLIGWHVNRAKDAAADFFPVSRFRSTFYRPDVVAKALGSLDERTALRLANEDAGRRAQAVDIAKTLPPVVQIVAPMDGAAVSTSEVRVRFAVRTASDAPIIGVRARVNGQAVNLGDARNTAVGTTADASRELAIPIPPQDSEIMLFAESRNGVSVPATLHVRWAGAVPAPPAASTAEFAVKPKLYVLSVGVAQYQDRALQLQYSAKDARDFANAMKLQGGRLYRDVEIRLLTDAQATRDAVVDGLEWLKTQVTYRDVGMLFLAGHGVNDPNGIYYFLPVNFSDQALMRTGVPFSDIRNTLSSIVGKALFFVDTCHSGNVMGVRRGATDLTGVVNELASAENGVVVFASSTGRQYSLESTEWTNGAFTKALVEGLLGQAAVGQTGRITHKMLDFYVAERVKILTKGQQTPVNTSPQGVPDFPIALVK